MARPSEYTQEIASAICLRLIQGESLKAICRDDSMPCNTSVYNWLEAYPEFMNQYTRARDLQADTWADELVYIADKSEDYNKARLQIDTRKWIASKLKPKKYGDKTETTHVGDKERPVIISPIDADL